MDVEVAGYFYNPNIQPLLEFRKRLKAVRLLCEMEKLPLVAEERYGLNEFLASVDYESEADEGGARKRCRDCYRMRLSRTAAFAVEGGYDAYSTTLLISHQQDNRMLMAMGREIASKEGIDFYCEDFRPLQARGLELAKRRSLYRQQYCGCIFSEYERYRDTKKYL
jgi:predicted adenine nucleotide alpha hydrolase (AANH) superfamily ATPase